MKSQNTKATGVTGATSDVTPKQRGGSGPKQPGVPKGVFGKRAGLNMKD